MESIGTRHVLVGKGFFSNQLAKQFGGIGVAGSVYVRRQEAPMVNRHATFTNTPPTSPD
jgi:hypothetical protein